MSTRPPSGPRADIGVIGGSGFYEFVEDAEPVTVDTPFGQPSGDLAVGEVPDQVLDRTWGRTHTFYGEVGPVEHVGFADPYCPVGRGLAVAAASSVTGRAVDGGTMAVINGPRSSRAESIWHRQSGADVVGMTGMPEAALARELALCFTAVAVVTDLDAGAEAGASVTHAEVLATFARSIEDLRRLLRRTIAALPPTENDETATCSCRRALDGLTLPFSLPQ